MDITREEIHELIGIREAAYNITGSKFIDETWHSNLTRQKQTVKWPFHSSNIS